jgi:hypothetical protein
MDFVRSTWSTRSHPLSCNLRKTFNTRLTHPVVHPVQLVACKSLKTYPTWLPTRLSTCPPIYKYIPPRRLPLKRNACVIKGKDVASQVAG